MSGVTHPESVSAETAWRLEVIGDAMAGRHRVHKRTK